MKISQKLLQYVLFLHFIFLGSQYLSLLGGKRVGIGALEAESGVADQQDFSLFYIHIPTIFLIVIGILFFFFLIIILTSH